MSLLYSEQWETTLACENKTREQPCDVDRLFPSILYSRTNDVSRFTNTQKVVFTCFLGEFRRLATAGNALRKSVKQSPSSAGRSP